MGLSRAQYQAAVERIGGGGFRREPVGKVKEELMDMLYAVLGLYWDEIMRLKKRSSPEVPQRDERLCRVEARESSAPHCSLHFLE